MRIMTTGSSSQRNSTLDAVKGFAIFLVVWGHCVAYMHPGPPGSFFDDSLLAAIGSFHMPLFMAVSGYLFGSGVQKCSASTLLGKRAQALLLPTIVWSALAYIEPYLSHLLRHLPMTVRLTNILWFLTSLMVCTVVALACEKLAGGNIFVYIAVILLALGLPDRFDLDYHKFMLPYFVGGLLLFRYSAQIPRVAYRLAWPLSFVLWSVMLAHWTADYYIYTTGMSLWVDHPMQKLWIIGYRYLIGFAGICWVVSVICYLRRHSKLTLLVWMGNFTLGIYAITAFFNPRLHRIPLPSFRSLPLWWAEMALFAFLQCVACIYAIKAMQHSQLLSLLLLGEPLKRQSVTKEAPGALVPQAPAVKG